MQRYFDQIMHNDNIIYSKNKYFKIFFNTLINVKEQKKNGRGGGVDGGNIIRVDKGVHPVNVFYYRSQNSYI